MRGKGERERLDEWVFKERQPQHVSVEYASPVIYTRRVSSSTGFHPMLVNETIRIFRDLSFSQTGTRSWRYRYSITHIHSFINT